MRTKIPLPLLLAAALLAGACGRVRDGADGAGTATDAADSSGLDGVSTQQLEQSAKPLSPEQARAMGIDSARSFPGSAEEVSDSGEPGVPETGLDSVGAKVPSPTPRDSAAGVATRRP